ncbi:hypothetical protein B296_00025008 [Ensete ventricosum]|uniref:Uncharacterized protein n=1 Tax=Ensete ventricosum TaxID=4639 RepID=A0A427ATV8_ENSVE|nr:hypothetical protein B296_00025008 [Ensete ventricosum]
MALWGISIAPGGASLRRRAHILKKGNGCPSASRKPNPKKENTERVRIGRRKKKKTRNGASGGDPEPVADAPSATLLLLFLQFFIFFTAPFAEKARNQKTGFCYVLCEWRE